MPPKITGTQIILSPPTWNVRLTGRAVKKLLQPVKYKEIVISSLKLL
jgi:hypothetical protein